MSSIRHNFFTVLLRQDYQSNVLRATCQVSHFLALFKPQTLSVVVEVRLAPPPSLKTLTRVFHTWIKVIL